MTKQKLTELIKERLDAKANVSFLSHSIDKDFGCNTYLICVTISNNIVLTFKYDVSDNTIFNVSINSSFPTFIRKVADLIDELEK